MSSKKLKKEESQDPKTEQINESLNSTQENKPLCCRGACRIGGLAVWTWPLPLLQALEEVGYETPSPIQAATIPSLLQGKDLVGQAQTGTGKTAAFALPVLSRLIMNQKEPQALVLTPTRELAIQVAEAFQRYACKLKGFSRLAGIWWQRVPRPTGRVFEEASMWVVGTPGRVMDHIRRKTLNLEKLTTLILDEADEMLRMGFIDDVEWILEQTPETRQIALFSATMPAPIRRIANRHLNDPEEVTIKLKTATADTIRQRYWVVGGYHKLDALTRILEAEPFDGMMIFVRTKTATVELAEKLSARGFACAPLNGDIPQAQRERTVERLKKGKFDILVATDVAARGLDVERISHVLNYDIPYDAEAYVHRIGRTGRAGRTGEAILFVAPRERRLLRTIERATKQKVSPMTLPTTAAINEKRVARFKQRITDTLANEDLDFFRSLIEEYEQEHEVAVSDIAAALAKIIQGEEPLLLAERREKPRTFENDSDFHRSDRKFKPRRSRKDSGPDQGMARFRLDVGHHHGVRPGNIVGAIANEGGLSGQSIARINIFDDYSTVDLPEDLPAQAIRSLKNARVSGRRLNLTSMNQPWPDKKPGKKKDKGKPKRIKKGARNKP